MNKSLIITIIAVAVLTPTAYFAYKKATYVTLPVAALIGENKLSECEYSWFIMKGNSSAYDVMQEQYDKGVSPYPPEALIEMVKPTCPNLYGDVAPDLTKYN